MNILYQSFICFLILLLPVYGVCFLFIDSEILFPFRRFLMFDRNQKNEENLEEGEKFIDIPTKSKIKSFFSRMFDCYYCTGFHIAYFVFIPIYFKFFIFDVFEFIVILFLLCFSLSIACYWLSILHNFVVTITSFLWERLGEKK